jgi:hypothetical protein
VVLHTRNDFEWIDTMLDLQLLATTFEDWVVVSYGYLFLMDATFFKSPYGSVKMAIYYDVIC